MAKKEKEEKKEKVSTKKTVSKKTSTKKSTTKKATPKKKVVPEVVEVPEEKKRNTVFGRIDKKYELDILDIMIVIVITAIASCVLTGFILNVQFRKMNPTYNLNLSKDENIKELLDVYSEVITNYYQEVDKKGMVEAGINGMLKFLGDNYSIYMNSSAAEDLNETLENTYEGIGIVTTNNVVYHVYDNTPASKAGIKEYDVIIKVNGVDISEENFEQISVLVQNNDGTNEIVVKRDDKELTFNVEKATVTVPVVSSRIIDMDKKKIGYISLSSFSSHATEEFTTDLAKLEEDDIDSLIIDLRGNTGGYLNQAKSIASIFLEKGKIIYSLENKDKTELVKDETSEKRKYKVVILVNGSTASASEVLTAALKDSYGATIVGKKTFGKGKVQNTNNYGDGSMLKYTTAKWLRPNGDCIDEEGIKPDYEVDLEYKGNLIYDKQLDKAIELLK
jgi:carboxyl-terminal processing protease